MACRISNLASLSLYSISGVYSSYHIIFDVKGLNIEYGETIFNIRWNPYCFVQKRPNTPNRKSGAGGVFTLSRKKKATQNI